MEFGILFTSHPNTDTEPYAERALGSLDLFAREVMPRFREEDAQPAGRARA